MKVSVIIPVYNGELYLEQCLESVRNQTLKDIEIICVDDGSTDSSLDILEHYKEIDDRFKVYHQENKYAGAARNLGKSHAQGDYLAFWDCDDFFELDALEKMYQKCVEQDADMCVCGAKNYDNETGIYYMKKDYLLMNKVPKRDYFSREDWEDYILNFTSAHPWNKLFKRSFIEEIQLDFQEIRNGNDIYFSMNAISLARRIVCVNEALINYRMNQNASLFGTLNKSPLIPIGAWISAAENLVKINAFPEKSFANKSAGSMVYLLRNIVDYEAFEKVFLFLKNEGLEKLHISQMAEEDFYNKNIYEIITHIKSDSPIDFHMYLASVSYHKMLENTSKADQLRKELKELKADYRKQEKEIAKLKKAISIMEQSFSYKTGKVVTVVPRKIKGLLKKNNVAK